VTDAAILSRSATGAIVVVAAGRTTTNQLSGALEALETVGAAVGGVVLTMVPTRGPDAYGYGYGYGYGGYGGYGTPALDPKAQKKAEKAQKKDAAAPETRTRRKAQPADIPAADNKAAHLLP